MGKAAGFVLYLRRSKLGKFVVEQKHEVWFRVSVEAESLTEAMELAMAELDDGGGVAGEMYATDDFWAKDVEADLSGEAVFTCSTYVGGKWFDGEWVIQG